MNRLSVVLADKFAFIPKQVKENDNLRKWVWFKKYTEVYIQSGKKEYQDIYSYDAGHSDDLHKKLLNEAYKREENGKKELKKVIKPYKNVLVSPEYYDYLCKIDSLEPQVIYTIHSPNGPRQIIYVPTERAIYNVHGAEPGDLVLEETINKMYKVYKVDMVTMRDNQILNVTYQYISDGSRDSILF